MLKPVVVLLVSTTILVGICMLTMYREGYFDMPERDFMVDVRGHQ